MIVKFSLDPGIRYSPDIEMPNNTVQRMLLPCIGAEADRFGTPIS